MFERLIRWAFVNVPATERMWAKSHAERDAPAFVHLTKPLNQVRLGLVTTGGVHHPDQPPFKRQADSPHGDGSWRELDVSRLPAEYEITHDWYDPTDAREDLDLVLPVSRVRELVDEGVVGSLAPVAAGVMGHVEDKELRRMEYQTGPEIAGLMQGAAVDAVLLVPA